MAQPGGWPILNFAPFAKFRVGMLEADPNQQPAVREENVPTQAKTRLEWATRPAETTLMQSWSS